MKWLGRLFLIVVLLAALAYGGACLWLKSSASRLIFTRSMPYVPPTQSLQLNPKRVEIGDLDGTKLYAWEVASLPADSASNAWLLFFHGSGDNVSVNANAYDDYRSMGFNVLAPEYPGYADSPGAPTEAGVYREARAAYDYLVNVKGVPPKRIAIFGGSLGAGIAIDLARQVDAGALIIASGFISGSAAGERMFPFLPIRLLLGSPFESDKKIGKVKMPVLVIHSVDDERFPIAENGEKLYELAPSPKQFLRTRGPHGEGATHASLNPRFYADIAAFLTREAGFQLHEPLPSVALPVAAVIDSAGVDSALACYHALENENPRRYNFREPELDNLAFDLLARKRAEESLSILYLNAVEFPESYRAYDSLGDWYVAAGQDSAATRCYRRALALMPGDGAYIRDKLERIGRKSTKG